MSRTLALLVSLLVAAVLPALADEDPALAVDGLAFAADSTERITWNSTPHADFYGIYRGRLGPGGLFTFGQHRCLATELSQPVAEDRLRPMPGTAFYYLATGLALRPDPEEMDWGPLGIGTVVRQEGSLPCGRRIFFDSEASGSGSGLSWADAYTTLYSATHHLSPEDRSLEIWMTGKAQESVAVASRDLVFYGGFRGDEKHTWERDPDAERFRWSAPPDADQLHGEDMTTCVRMHVVFDRLRFEGGRHAVFFMLSGMTFDVLDSVFDHQVEEAFDINPPTDYACGVNVFTDRSRFAGSGPEPLLDLDFEGGEAFDLRLHRTVFRGESGPLIRAGSTDGVIGSEGRLEMLGCDLRGGDVNLLVDVTAMNDEHLAMELALASNLFAGAAEDAIRIALSAGWGDCRVTGEILHNTISDAGDAGVECLLRDDSGTGGCTPTLASNLITFAGKFGVAEPDHSAPGIDGDFTMIGNDLYGNGEMYLDDGTDPLSSVDEVNALPGCWGNISADPLYADRPAGDYHLGSGSKAIDTCVQPPSPWIVVDMDGEPRSMDGDPKTPLAADLGADEH